jgi:predicted metal-dependent HD superfamily phosphohydrolase
MGLMTASPESSAQSGRLLLPETFRNRWLDLWSAFSDQDGSEIFNQICMAYNESHRFYHNIGHLVDCLTHIETYEALAIRPHELEFALWFHDAIYKPSSNDNELRSAQWAQRVLRHAHAKPEAIQRIYNMILATKTHLGEDADTQLLLDIDLSILGSSPEIFARYEHRIRQEYQWIPGFIFRRHRRRFVKAMLERDTIYQTDLLHHRFESQARENLQRSLKQLG